MRIYKDVDANDVYEMAWSGARNTLEELNVNQVQAVLDMLEDANCGEAMSETELNDFLWFERDTIAHWLGYRNFDEIMNENRGIEVRYCDECGCAMSQGYCVDGGAEYYCSDECLHEHFTDEEWEEECANNEDSYWTEW